MKIMNRYQLVLWIMLLSIQFLFGQEKPLHRFGEDHLMLARQIRVTGDEVLVLDENGPMTPGDEKIKIFTLNGDYKTEFGRGGSGPGEFKQAFAFDIAEGKIFVLDSLRQQVHIFSLKSKKFIESKKVLNTNPNGTFSTPCAFSVAPGERFYYHIPNSVQGQKLITLMTTNSLEIKMEKEFLDCFPIYKSAKEFYNMTPNQLNEPENIRKDALNMGYLATSGNKIYFTFWLVNNVFEFSMDGAILNRYTLPIQSIAETVRLRKVGRYYTLDRKLNYGMINDGNLLYVISRDTAGETLLFKLEDGKFIEIFRTENELFGGAITGTKFYAISSDQSEIWIYNINQK